MSQRDNFGSGFLAGTIVGGLVGGIVGALIASGRASETDTTDASLLNPGSSEAKPSKGKKRQLKDSESIEFARRGLEDKIAQLNAAIDEVRTQLGTVNGKGAEIERERFSSSDTARISERGRSLGTSLNQDS
jgi:gas vesicle protein